MIINFIDIAPVHNKVYEALYGIKTSNRSQESVNNGNNKDHHQQNNTVIKCNDKTVKANGVRREDKRSQEGSRIKGS